MRQVVAIKSATFFLKAFSSWEELSGFLMDSKNIYKIRSWHAMLQTPFPASLCNRSF